MRSSIAWLLAATLGLGLAQTASAADMPVKAPAYKAPHMLPTYNWSGIYVGGNVGYMWARQSAFWPGTVLPNNTFDHDQNVGVGGVQLGVQYQWTSLVLGVEAAWFGKFNGDEATGTPLSGCPNAVFTCQVGLDSVWTVGPRLGWAQNNWLIYGTGGYANGNVKTRSFTTATGVVFDDFGARHGGWFAGVGVEYALWKSPGVDAILGIEYQHIDLGTVRLLSPADGGVFGVDTRDVSSTADLVRARLSIKTNVFH
jgi:outer membrane immunogenic protein